MVRSTKVEKTTTTPVAAAPVAAPVEVKAATEVKPKAAKAPKAPKATAPAVETKPVVVEVKPVAEVKPTEVAEAAAPVVAEESAEASSETRLAELESKLQQVNNIFTSMKSSVKDLRKAISREKKAAEKSSKHKAAKKVNKDRKPSGFTKPTLISDELAKFLGKPAGTEMSRTAAAKEVIAYIQSNKLTDEKDGRIIHPDAALAALLKVTSADNVHYFNFQTFMKPHFIKATPAATA